MGRLSLIFIFFLTGCSAFLVPETNDPNEKLGQAFQLWKTGRPIPAERIAIEALDIFKQSNDVKGVAETEDFLGAFYKQKSGWGNVSKEEFINKALFHLNNALDAYTKMEEFKQVSRVTFEIGQAYRGLEKMDVACDYYRKSLEMHSNAKGNIPWVVQGSNTTSPEVFINAHLEQLCTDV
jgi:tetratricopeptide (TPR) repeat protein